MLCRQQVGEFSLMTRWAKGVSFPSEDPGTGWSDLAGREAGGKVTRGRGGGIGQRTWELGLSSPLSCIWPGPTNS